MKKVLSILFLLSSLALHAQYFQHSYGWGPFNTAPSVAWSFQHTFELFGSFSSSTSGQTDYVLLRVDSSGDFLDAHAYGSGGVESAQHILALPDSGFLLTGFSNGFAANNDYDAYVIRTNAEGDTVWTKSYGSPVWDFAYCTILLNNGNYLIAGSSNQSVSGVSAGWLSVLSPGGQLIQEKRIELNGMNVWLTGVVQAANGALYVSGYTESISSQLQTGCVFRLDQLTLDSTWCFLATTASGNSRFNGLATTLDGNIVACGYSIDPGRTDKDIFVMSLDTSGVPQWTRIFATPGEEYFNSITTCGDSILCAGMTNSFGGGNNDCYVVALDSAGNFLHGSTFGSSENEIGNAIISKGQKDFAVFGTTTSYGPGLQSMMLVTCDSLLDSSNSFVVSAGESIQINPQPLNVYPNPATTGTTLYFGNGSTPTEKKISIVGLRGELIYNTVTSADKLSIPMEQWCPGYYLVNIIFCDGSFQSRKLLLAPSY